MEISYRRLNFKFEPLTRIDVIHVDKAWSVDNISDLRPLKFSYSQLRSWGHLKGLLLPHMTDSRASLLIGPGMSMAYCVFDQRRGGSDEPYVIKSTVG